MVPVGSKDVYRRKCLVETAISLIGSLQLIIQSTVTHISFKLWVTAWSTGDPSSQCEELSFFIFMRTFSETWHIQHKLLHNDRIWHRETWLSPCTIWRCFIWERNGFAWKVKKTDNSSNCEDGLPVPEDVHFKLLIRFDVRFLDELFKVHWP